MGVPGPTRVKRLFCSAVSKCRLACETRLSELDLYQYKRLTLLRAISMIFSARMSSYFWGLT